MHAKLIMRSLELPSRYSNMVVNYGQTLRNDRKEKTNAGLLSMFTEHGKFAKCSHLEQNLKNQEILVQTPFVTYIQLLISGWIVSLC